MSAPRPDGPLAGRVALVTGAAGRIGRATAEAITAAGGRVLATDLDAAGLGATAHGIRTVGGAHAVATRVADLGDVSSAEVLVAAAVAELGRLDVVVHAAVDPGTGRLEELTVEQWERAFAVNVAAAAWLVQAALPHLARSQGSVVLFSSIQARLGIPGCSLYASTKGAIESFTRHIAVELAPRGVRVNAISPGWVTDSEAAAVELASYPLGRLGRPADIASAVTFLASDAASWITGTVLPVDGGTHAVHPGWVARQASSGSPRGAQWRQRIARRVRRSPA